MAGRAGFSIVIQAVDVASKQIDAINKRLAALQAPVTRVQKSLAKFADLSGLRSLGNGFRDLAGFSLRAFQSLSRIIEPLAAITGAVSIAGMVKLTTAFGEFGTRLGFSAQRIGLASDQLQGLQGAARLAGASSQSLTAGMQTLGDTLTDAVAGRAPEAVVMLNTLGISLRDQVTGGARKAADVLPELADKIARIQNPALQARAATALLGGAAEDLLPFLRRGAAGIADYVQQAQFYGVTNEKGVQAAMQLQQAQTRLQLSIEGLVNSIGERLSPILAPLLTQMANWIATNRDWIATGIATHVQDLATWLRSIDWAAVGNGAKEWGQRIKDLIDGIGGLKTAGEAVAVYFAGGWLLSMLGTVSKVVSALSGLGALGGLGGALGAAVVGTPLLERAGIDLLNQGLGITPTAGGGPRGHAANSGARRGVDVSARNQGTPAAARAAIDYFMSQGWTREQAAGLAANLNQESGFDPSAVGDSGQAYGLGQWHADRQAAFRAAFGHDIQGSSQQEQLQFVQYELTHNEAAAAARLRAAQTAAQAGAIVSQFYERPADADGEAQQRASAAELLLAQQPAPTVAQGPVASIDNGSGANGAGTQTLNGQASLTVRLANFPQGTQTMASATGGLFSGPPRIVMAMPGARSP